MLCAGLWLLHAGSAAPGCLSLWLPLNSGNNLSLRTCPGSLLSGHSPHRQGTVCTGVARAVCRHSEKYNLCVCMGPEMGPALPGLCVRLCNSPKDVGPLGDCAQRPVPCRTPRMLGRFQTSSRPTLPTTAFQVPLSRGAGSRVPRTEPTCHVKGNLSEAQLVT